jgi:hypothetical protein
LKPENIFLTRDGHLKILDFGLAKQTAASSAVDGQTSLNTEAGVVLGTVAYMSPEQIRGERVDDRTDLFACGVVLYELLTGRRPFQRDTSAETMTAILKDEAPEIAAPSDLPPTLRRISRRALEKEPNDRFQSARDLAFDLESVAETVDSTATGVRGSKRVTAMSAREAVAWAMAAALAIAAATLFWRDRSAGAPARVVTYTLDDKADLSALSIQPVGLVVSPDGSRIFSQTPANERQLFVRRLDQPAATLLPNTELGRVLFIAPDGTWVGFGTLNTLKRVSLVDGTVVTICQTETVPSTAAVSAGGDIVFSMGLALWIVPADGGTPRPLTVLAPTEQAQAVSGFLPDGRTLLFTNWLADRSRIETLDIADGTRNVLLDQAAGGQCISNGYLLFARDGALLAAPLDLASRSTGAAVRVLDRIQTGMLGIPKLGVSPDGSVLAYAEPLRASLVWVSRTGLETPLDLPPRQYQFVAVSGDGRRVALPRNRRSRSRTCRAAGAHACRPNASSMAAWAGAQAMLNFRIRRCTAWSRAPSTGHAPHDSWVRAFPAGSSRRPGRLMARRSPIPRTSGTPTRTSTSSPSMDRRLRDRSSPPTPTTPAHSFRPTRASWPTHRRKRGSSKST